MSNVLVVTNDFPPTVGGIQSYVRDFVSLLDPSTVHVLTSTQDEREARKYDSSVPYTVHRMRQTVLLPTPSVVRSMARIITAYKIDVVWFGAAAPLGLLANVARTAGAKKIVASTHGHEVGWTLIPGARQLVRKISADVDVVTYISEYTRAQLEPALSPSTRYVRMPSGVDIHRFTPGPGYDHAGELWVVCVSRLVQRKGQDWLIRSVSSLAHIFPVRLIIVGEGPDSKRLERLADGLSVTFTGRVDRSAMVEYIRSADVFAMPARTRLGGLDVEGLGIVYLEAQACGIPVIAGASGGAPETITEDTGFVAHSPEELTAQLKELLGDSELRARLGRAGREYVEREWSWEKIGKIAQHVLAL
ncbi:glycosyltransferase family 4 protein [Corynebacterium glucuronolyticum]|uniref:glycosyltransferase family 4 protein n=1 Tax=Corynebacterium glucuronolyticum TaxID=39791 RepID=UPI00019C1ED5|nr:glycosyltransferase family 4 protein [Corynebacterium glucuronolyticum]EEI26714.1 glycosyltransferase, group 1 family protein [Corynebacterium glucuronolyticum ATCC 51867]QQU89256.1 glycosyltransferase family 4 protein [Corynebacterium glucuronolyticum]QRO82908.1 glycosyltransferase family 4 protein [Corynebacterium glucuronolyticum]